jgi:hypothetical protein
MFLDSFWQGEPPGPVCRSCKQPIGENERIEEVQFPHDPEHNTHEMSGVYHAACARPFRSIAYALRMLGGGFF